MRIACIFTWWLFLASCRGTTAADYAKQGDQFFAKQQYEEALLNYRKAIQKDPKSADAYYRAGLTLLRLKKSPDAFAVFTRAVELQPSHEAARIEMAELCVSDLLRDPLRAQRLYGKLNEIAEAFLAKDANSYYGHRYRGFLAMADAKPEEAAKHFQIAYQANPDVPETAALAAQNLLRANRPAEAESLALQGLERHPAYAPLYDALYFQYVGKNQMALAEALLKRKIAANPQESLYQIQLARHYRRVGDASKVQATLDALRGNRYPDGYRALGDFYRETGDWRQAVQAYQQGAAAKPGEKLIYQKAIVATLLTHGQSQAAAELLNGILAQGATDPEVRAARAMLRLASTNPSEIDAAISEFQNLVKEAPEAISYRYDLARAYLRSGRREEARRELQAVLQKKPDFLPALRDLARLHISSQQIHEASVYAGQVLAVDPSDPEVRLIQTAVKALRGERAEARQELLELLREYPNLLEAQLQLALLYADEKRYSEAETVYRKLYRPGAPDLRVLRGLTEVLIAAGQPDRVWQTLQEEFKRQPASRELRTLLASTAARTGKTDLAIEHYLWVKQQNPGDAQVEAALGLLYQTKGDLNAAVAQFETARKLAPEEPAILAALGFAHQQAGRPQQAVAIYREALARRPDYPAVMNNLAVALADSGGDLSEALRLSREALKREPDNSSYLDALGLVYLKQKEFDSAVQTLRAAVAKQPDRALYRLHLAKALLGKGDRSGARAELNAVTGLRPSPEEARQAQELLAQIP